MGIEKLSIYYGDMGISFYEDVVIQSDAQRYKVEEGFGISHNRLMDLEAFMDMLKSAGVVIHKGEYVMLDATCQELIGDIIAEFKYE